MLPHQVLWTKSGWREYRCREEDGWVGQSWVGDGPFGSGLELLSKLPLASIGIKVSVDHV